MSNLYLLSGILYCTQCNRPMRAQAAHGVHQFQDKRHIRHTGECDQETVKAEEVEEQVAQYLASFHLPQNWREDVVARLYPAEDRAAMEREEQAIRARMERPMEMYLAGDADRVHYERETRASYDRLADLRLAGYSDLVDAGGTLERFEHLLGASTVGLTLRASQVAWRHAQKGTLCAGGTPWQGLSRPRRREAHDSSSSSVFASCRSGVSNPSVNQP